MSVSIISQTFNIRVGTCLILQSKTVCSVWTVSINHNLEPLGQLQIPFDEMLLLYIAFDLSRDQSFLHSWLFSSQTNKLPSVQLQRGDDGLL